MKEGNAITVRVKYTKDRKGEWRFAFIASNGKTLAVSSEGYKRKADAVVALDLIMSGDADFPNQVIPVKQ